MDRAVIESTDDTTAKARTAHEQVVDEVERAQPFGLSSRPPDGAMGVVVYVDEDHPVVIQSGDRRYVLTGLAAGGVALHDASLRTYVKLNNDNTIELAGATIRLGVAGTPEPAVLGTALLTWLATHTHAGVTPGPGASGPSALPTTGITSASVTVQP